MAAPWREVPLSTNQKKKHKFLYKRLCCWVIDQTNKSWESERVHNKSNSAAPLLLSNLLTHIYLKGWSKFDLGKPAAFLFFFVFLSVCQAGVTEDDTKLQRHTVSG